MFSLVCDPVQEAISKIVYFDMGNNIFYADFFTYMVFSSVEFNSEVFTTRFPNKKLIFKKPMGLPSYSLSIKMTTPARRRLMRDFKRIQVSFSFTYHTF